MIASVRTRVHTLTCTHSKRWMVIEQRLGSSQPWGYRVMCAVTRIHTHTCTHAHTHSQSPPNPLFTAWYCTPPLWGELGWSLEGALETIIHAHTHTHTHTHTQLYVCSMYATIEKISHENATWELNNRSFLYWTKYSCNTGCSMIDCLKCTVSEFEEHQKQKNTSIWWDRCEGERQVDWKVDLLIRIYLI